MIPELFRSKPGLQWGPNVNVVWDGNSLVATSAAGGVGNGGTPLPARVAALAPTSAASATTNCGIGGQTWAQMTSAASDVDAAWAAGKTNVLILWETTNSVCNAGRTGLQAMADAAAYIAARRAVHPWIVVCLTTIPREAAPTITDQTTRDAANAQLVAADAYLKANAASMGVDAVVDMRQAGSPFAFANYLSASFDAIQSLLTESGPNRVHLNGGGYDLAASYVTSVLMRLRKSAY